MKEELRMLEACLDYSPKTGNIILMSCMDTETQKWEEQVYTFELQ